MHPLLGVRREPGRLALAVFGIMPALYRLGLGRGVGRTFLLLTYKGRKTGAVYRAALMILGYEKDSGEAVSLAMYGSKTGWLRNVIASPALAMEVGGRTYPMPLHRLLSEDEALAVIRRFQKAHPGRVWLATRILGWGRLETEAELRAFVRAKPFIAFRPADVTGEGVQGIA